LPQGCLGAGIVRREKQRQHIEQAEGAGRPDANSKEQSDADSQFAICDKEGDWRCVRKNEATQHGSHEGISALGEETIDPELKAAMQRELRGQDLVLAENQKENAYGNAQEGECARVVQGKIWHGRDHFTHIRQNLSQAAGGMSKESAQL